jgi:lysophospholipase L1-like esterase
MASVSIVLNGGTVVTAANTPVTPTTLYIGNTNNGASGLFTGHIRVIAAYSDLSDTDLQTISAAGSPLAITPVAAGSVAASAGANVSAVVGQWLQNGVAASAGANTSSVTATWKQDGVAASAGSNTSSVTATWKQDGVASSAGANTATVTATWKQNGVASSAGANTSSVTATWKQDGVASSAGTNTSSATAAPIQSALASSAGSNISAVTATWLQSGVASSAGANTASVTATWGQAGIAASAGTNTGSGTATWGQAGVAASVGVNTASVATPSAGAVTWNPSDKDTNVTLSNGNLTATHTGSGAFKGVRATSSGTTGYFEYTVVVSSDPNGNDTGVGLANSSAPVNNWLGSDNNGIGYYPDTGGAVYYNGSAVATGLGSPVAGDVVGIELTSTPSIKFSKNGTVVYTYTGTIPSGSLFPDVTFGAPTDSGTANFGATTMAHLPAGVTSWDGSQTGGGTSSVASSAGANTASVVGQWLQAGVASSAGANTASVTGRWSQAGVASSAGSNTALVSSSPVGTNGVASSAGANTASAVGRWLQAGVASSAGTNTASVASPAVMPAGAVGIWYVDQYSASPSGIQNAVGSTALTSAGTADGNLYLAGGTTPSGGVLDFNSGEIGTVVFPSSVSLPAATVIYSCSKVSDSTGVHVIVADRASYHFWSVGEDVSGFGPGYQIFSSEFSGQQNGSLWDKVGNGWHISSLSYDASSAECWIDGIQVISRSVTTPTHSLTSLDIGQVAGTINAGYKVNAIAFYNRKLSASEQASAYAALKARAALSSLTIPSTSPERILYAMGDSITDGSFGDIGIGAANPGYVYAAARSATPVIRGGNLGVGGRTIATTDTAFDSTYGPMISAAVAAAAGSGRNIICTMALGTNDLLTYPGGVSAWLTAFAALCDKVRATGAKLIVATIIPNIDPTFNARRATANPVIRTWVGTHADAIMDFASDPIMGLDATASNGTYFADGTHPRGAGHALMAPYLVSAINSLSFAPSTTAIASSAGANLSAVTGTWIQAGVATSAGQNVSSAIVTTTVVGSLDFSNDFSASDFGVVGARDFSHDFAGDFSGGFNAGISGDFNQDFSNDFAVFVGVHIVSGTATSAGSNIASVRGTFGQGPSLDYNQDYSADFAVYGQLSDSGVASSTGSNISSMVGSWEAIPVPPYVPAPEPVVKQWVPASEFQRVQQPRADRVYRTVPELRRVQPSRATRIIQTGPSARRINLPNMKRRYG